MMNNRKLKAEPSKQPIAGLAAARILRENANDPKTPPALIERTLEGV